ncbi:C40 family peptidase [Deinococcus sp. YIM 77859]|uniref:C40 family peptidase n=1 Tax=Deinococcus sp. YIM 77859 TaxID=1540221 RepID=UPI0005523498|nr:C40 family peptidase [Deinococcus sp. YIM 77859]
MKAFRTLLMAAALGSCAGAATYTVKAGDTLYRVALANNLEPAELMRLNGLSSTTLRVGQQLQVGQAGPAATTAPAAQAQPAKVPSGQTKGQKPVATAAQPKAAPSTKKSPAGSAQVKPAGWNSGGAFIRTAASRFLGIRYALGGTGNGGLDCSGFTMRVFQQMGIRLPRTAAGQWNTGRPVSSRNLQPGDLVFFNTTGRGVSHVGIYVGGGQMANANSYRGRTIIEPLFGNPYWASRYIGARRVLS